MPTHYPAAHLLGLPSELREAIYEYVAADQPVLHLKDSTGSVHLSAAHTQPLSLIQAHPLLYIESLADFHRTQTITLHVDAFAFAKLRNPNVYAIALQNNRYIQQSRSLELRYVMNAHVEFLVDAIKHVTPVLLSPTCNVKTVTVTWAEAVPIFMQRMWRPWVYKSPALEPLWDLVGAVDLKCGGVVNAPRATAELQDKGFRRSMDMILKYKALSEGASAV